MKRNSLALPFLITLALGTASVDACAEPAADTLQTAMETTSAFSPKGSDDAHMDSHPVRDSGIGCATGAVMGSVLPGLGNAVGCVVGAVFGWWMS